MRNRSLFLNGPRPGADHLSGAWFGGVRRLVSSLALVLVVLCASNTGAQTTLVSEGFEGIFPGAWSIGDSNASSGLVYWKDVNNSFGSVLPHTGSWKGYCAGYSNGVAVSTATYATYMQADMSRSVNLAGYTGANLGFWYNIPSIETNYDSLRVYMDSTLVWFTTVGTPGWSYKTLPLNAYLGGTHSLRFEFYSDVTIVREGAYLDDILVDAANQPFISTLQSLQNANYTGYVLDSDSLLGRSNIQAQAVFNVENFTGSTTTYTNVLSFRLINAGSGLPHPIYNAGNVTTNIGYTYDITNVLTMAAGTNVTYTDIAYLRPAAWMSQFTNFYIECRMLTNGVVAQTLTTTPTNYYHFTNTVAGDAAYNVLLNLTNSSWSRTYAVQTVAGQNSFHVNVGYEVRRWDDYGLGLTTTNVPVILNYVLRDSLGNVMSLLQSSQTFYDSVSNYQVAFIFPVPTFKAVSHTLSIYPANQLDSVNRTYYLTVTLGHTNNPVTGQVLTANTGQTTTNELLHFNGNLVFGSIGTTLTSLGVVPPVNPSSGGVIPTTLNLVGGYVTAKADHTYAGGGPLSVDLYPNGDARVTGGSVSLAGPSPDSDSIARVRFQRSTVTLSPSGGSATLRIWLPTGMGYRFDTTSLKLLPTFSLPSVALTASLVPAADQTFSPGGTIYAVEESKPVWLTTDRIVWHVASGQFDFPPLATPPIYVRSDAYAYLSSVSNVLVDPPKMGDKRSNDKYWLALNGTASLPTVKPDTGSNSLLTVKFAFGPGAFETHFPYGTPLRWLGTGNMQVTDDLVTPGGSSVLNSAANVSVGYTRDCPDCGGGGAGTTHATIVPGSGELSFTRDGGVVAYGATTATVNLQWGYIGSPTFDYAQQAFGFNEAGFHMPGVFLRGDQNSLPAVQRPTTILYSGVMATNPVVIERPVTTGYTQGLADYAGLNFRCMSDGAHTARSTIAGEKNIDWKLDARSKYYIRPAGVTGIHEAVPGSFPSSLTLWGYQFTFTSYGLSYLDSQNKDSVTDGAVDLPSPSDFTQGFNNMQFSCLGAPLGGDVPEGDGYKVMSYWAADFKTLSITFKIPPGCDITSGYLVLGIEGHASHVDKPMYGQVGFFNNGDQIPASFGLEGVTSRLKVPNVISMDGPNDSTYTFTPVQDAYYNTYNNSPPAPVAGWMNIFGKLDVPFFEDLQLHLQTSCHTNGVASSNAPIYLSGGWPRFGTSNPNHGWLDPSGYTPFETNFFDANNLGWPGSGTIDIANYRNNTSEDYHPRAQRLWLGVIDFDYPLSWDTTLRSFKSWQQTDNDLLVVNVQHEIKYMDAKRAEIDFGAQYDGLPQISVANLAFNAIDETTGVGDAIVKAAAQPVEDVLSSGLDNMDKLLDTQMKGLMDGVFDKSVDPIVDKFYNQISNEWSGLSASQRLQFVQNVQSNTLNYFVGTGPLSPSLTPLTSALKDMGNGVTQASNLVGQIRGYLRDATNAINAVVGTINMTTNGQSLGSNVVGLIAKQAGSRPVVPKLVNSLVGEIAPQFVDAVVGPALSNAVQGIEGPLSQITDTLTQTRDAIMEVDKQLGVGGDFTSEISDTLGSFSSELTNVSVQVSLSVTQYFGQFDYHIDDPFQDVSAADVKQFIRQKVEDQFFATDAAAAIQTAIRQRVYDLDAAMKTQIDSVFQQLNGVMRDLISQSLAQVDNSISKCLGDVSDVMGAGQLNGHALIDGDSLKELRIDGHFQWKVPDNFELNAFLLIKELDSDGSATGCPGGAGPATEVTIGATDVPVGWISSDMKANVEAKFTFDGSTPLPVNLAGQLELIGDLDFETFTLHDLAAAMAFGKYENYLALKGGVRFNGYDFSGAIFFGKTCTLDPLVLIDPDVASVLGDPPFTGAYCYAQGWLPVSELVLGVPASCLFEISAGVGAGAFYFAEGPTYGGKMFLGVSGELLCIVSIEGDITMIGLKHGDDLRFKGHGHFEADVGPCPFCITVSKSVDIIYMNNSWDIQ